MFKVVTTRPPSTYIFIPSLQFNSILEKLYFCYLMLKATKFFWCWILKFFFATSVVGATGGSWLEGAYVLTPLPTNRAKIRRVRKSLEEQDQNRFQKLSLILSCSLFLSFSHVQEEVEDSWTCQESFKKKKKHANYSVAALQPHAAPQHCSELQRRSNASCSATAPQQCEL